jgi:hypothetical protein
MRAVFRKITFKNSFCCSCKGPTNSDYSLDRRGLTPG